MQNNVIKLIVAQASELNEQMANKIPVELGVNAPLYGKSGVLDSVGLVTFIVAVEQAIEDEFDAMITLADEKAMSQKNSPFRTIGTLADYIVSLLNEDNEDNHE
jgi:D-alanine--poly(phosphoribitol) ligase subunit 2